MLVGTKSFKSPARSLVRSLSKSRDAHQEKRRELELQQGLADKERDELRLENERLQKMNAQLQLQNAELRFEQDFLKKLQAAVRSAVTAAPVRRKVRRTRN